MANALSCSDKFRNCQTCSGSGDSMKCVACNNSITLLNGQCLSASDSNLACDKATNKYLKSITINGVTYKDCAPCPARCLNGCSEDASSGTTVIVCNECRPGFVKNATTKNCDSLCGDGPFAVQISAPTGIALPPATSATSTTSGVSTAPPPTPTADSSTTSGSSTTPTLPSIVC